MNSRSLLISVALGSAILGVTLPFSWHHFSVQAYKNKLAAKEIADVEVYQQKLAAKAAIDKENRDRATIEKEVEQFEEGLPELERFAARHPEIKTWAELEKAIEAKKR